MTWPGRSREEMPGGLPLGGFQRKAIPYFVEPDVAAIVGERSTALPDGEVRKVAAWVPVSSELLEDQPMISNYITLRMETMFDRQERPWAYADRPAIRWTFDPFPRTTRARHYVVGRVMSIRHRLARWLDPFQEED